MGKSKKRFIDKKNSITFTLVHRSQKDPLLVDESAPQHVLKPVKSANSKDKAKRKEEQIKYGIYFDDEYDYLQHLRDTKDNSVEMERVFIPAKTKNKAASSLINELNTPSSPGASLQLPSSVFASRFEESVGLLNKAAPESGLQLHLDPDIVAAMDEDFDFDNPDNQLEDDFVLRAKGNSGCDYEEDDDECSASGSGEDENDAGEDEDDYEDMSSDFSAGEERDEFDETGAPALRDFEQEETRSRFTEYSMSSSIMRRNQNLTFLDDTFEQMFAKYDDTEIGALECEDIEGEMLTNDERLLAVAEEFEKERQVQKFNTEKSSSLCARIAEETESEDEEDEFERMVIREKEKWDCESILSTYSNIYNHPTLITEAKTNKIKFNPRTGLPLTPVTSKLTPHLLATHDELLQPPGTDPRGRQHRGEGSIISAISALSVRDKNETREEKRTRQNALRELRRERRVEKKANKMAFKDEKKKVERQFINQKVQQRSIQL